MMRRAAQALPREGFGYSERDHRVFRTVLAGRPGIFRRRYAMTFIAYPPPAVSRCRGTGQAARHVRPDKKQGKEPRFTL
jgi:hypothetical protein